MCYTAEGYFRKIVRGARVQLVGWPAGIPFGNVSELKGGGAVVECLLRELESGRMHFRHVSYRRAERIAMARMTPEVCLPRPPRRGRSDVKVHRLRRVTAALYPLTGPKTPATIEDSDSESEDAADPIEQWEEEEEEETAVVADEIEQWAEDGEHGTHFSER